jgi:uncharacterized protein (TIGR02246 family)
MTEPQPTPGWARKAGQVALAPASADTTGGNADAVADRLAIAELIARYGWGYDERDLDTLADCFTADGVWEGSLMGADGVGPHQGREAVVAFLTDFWGVQTDQRRHIFTNVVVTDLSGDRATAHAYLLLTASTGGTMTPVTNGPYRFEVRRDGDGVWRMARLVAGFDAPF